MRHQCYFPQTPCAFIRIQKLVQHFLALAGLRLDNTACLERTWILSISVP